MSPFRLLQVVCKLNRVSCFRYSTVPPFRRLLAVRSAAVAGLEVSSARSEADSVRAAVPVVEAAEAGVFASRAARRGTSLSCDFSRAPVYLQARTRVRLRPLH